LFTHEQEENSIKTTLEAAIKVFTSLLHANLHHADLSHISLGGANLIDTNLGGADLGAGIT
jgi:uncharacterized protein YjbI with pentapeptide repeats